MTSSPASAAAASTVTGQRIQGSYVRPVSVGISCVRAADHATMLPRQQTRPLQGRTATAALCSCHHSTPYRRTLSKPCYAAKTHLNHASYSNRCPSAASAAVQRPRRPARTTAVVPTAYLHSDPLDSSSGSNQSVPRQLKVLIVGANPAGLTAAVALAQQVGCAVEVHDSRPDPRGDKHADNSSTLVALGEPCAVLC